MSDVSTESRLPATEADDASRDARRDALREILDLGPGQRLERLYLFEAIERRDVAFSLALVTKRLDEDRLEMVALGARSVPPAPPAHDFVRRARFPERVLPRILEEFIDRGGAAEAGYREFALGRRAGADSLEELVDLLGLPPETS